MMAAEEFGDAEIEQLRSPVFGDDDVAWLEVTMHDQVSMRELHRRTDLAKELQPR